MTSIRIRAVLALTVASVTLVGLTACAPPVLTHPTTVAGPTLAPKPRITAKPIALHEPASRYSFGCDNLVTAAGLSSLYAIPMTATDEASWERFNDGSGIPDGYFIAQLGGIDCLWSDGKKTTDDNSHTLQVTVLPVTPAQWQTFISDANSDYVVGGAEVDCEGDGPNSCTYDSYINGSRVDIEADNMSPSVGSKPTVMPAQVKAVVATITSLVTSTPIGTVPAAQHPSVTLPMPCTSMLTVDQVRAAVGAPSATKLAVQCDTVADGPWTAGSEARTQVMGGVRGTFGTPEVGDSGDAYGLFDFLPAGGWAAPKLVGYTPSSTPVSIPGLPAGDSFTEYTDYSGAVNGTLVIGGNLIDITLLVPFPSDLPATSQTPKQAMVSIVQDFEKTIRG